ncbi:MAG: heavy metal translocating P-type ATPase [Gammaproteobacteria bacterium]|nr:heavy metal translocating P-type ATPase [Gammaproteobacteria bacterium]
MNKTCYHCHLDVPSDINFQLEILGKTREFCCPGCLAVAETICNSGMQSFYQYRNEKSIKPEDILPQEMADIESLDIPEILSTISTEQDEVRTIELGIEGISCAACSWLIKNTIGKREEVNHIEVNTTTRRAIISYKKDNPVAPIIKQIRELGYQAFPFNEEAQEKAITKENKLFIRRLLVAGLAMMQVMMFSTGLYIGEAQDIAHQHARFLHWISGLLATMVVFYSALPFFKNAINGLKNRHFGMDLPVSLAIGIGYLASVYSLLADKNVFYFDSIVMFTFFLLIGRYLEHRARLKAILKQQNFRKLIPISVNRQTQKNKIEIIPVGQVQINDIILIHAGAIVPVDGFLLDDAADLNESVLTGEFLPVHKKKGEDVISGSTNNGGSFKMQVSNTLEKSRISKLGQLQSQSENIASHESDLADQIANWYVIILLIVAFISSVIWFVIDPDMVFPILLSVLVVSCPCALSLATPAAIASAVAQLTDKGLMLKNSHLLERGIQITDIYFDKTGTLTLGKMTLLETSVYDPSFSREDCLNLAANMESVSSHPLAEAFKPYKTQSIKDMKNQERIAEGIISTLDDHEYRLGKANFVFKNVKTSYENFHSSQSGNIEIHLSKNDKHIATFLLSDQINPTAKQTIQSLMNEKYAVTLISGDSQISCQSVADKLSISDFENANPDGQIIYNATPESKLEAIEKAQLQGKNILMVGDGVNDIGAMSAAQVSITMSSASHLSRAASDSVLVSQDLEVIYHSLKTTKKLGIIIKQNLTWAVLYNLIALPFAIAGFIPPWLAAIGMTSSSLIVVLNALRLRK